MDIDQEVKKTLELLKKVFDTHMALLEDHKDFEHIGQGKIKKHIKPDLLEEYRSEISE